MVTCECFFPRARTDRHHLPELHSIVLRHVNLRSYTTKEKGEKEKTELDLEFRYHSSLRKSFAFLFASITVVTLSLSLSFLQQLKIIVSQAKKFPEHSSIQRVQTLWNLDKSGSFPAVHICQVLIVYFHHLQSLFSHFHIAVGVWYRNGTRSHVKGMPPILRISRPSNHKFAFCTHSRPPTDSS